jgi:FAD/FMN-containing dehydrogenase
MTQLLEPDIGSFRETFGGVVMSPGHRDYDTARSLWNGAIDHRPAVVAGCLRASDVAEALRFARDQELEVSVRGGGHSFSGASVCDAGLMIDLSRMNGVSVDPAARRARCGGGTTWAALDAATQEHGLATPGGTISHTGVGGLTLGGGFGWLTGKAGLSCENVVAAEVVTADGRILHASAAENPDLFWAIRGGGGNFGVVTSFEFQLHEVGPMVQLGLLFWAQDRGTEALRLIAQVLPTLPRTMGALLACLNAPPAPWVPAEHQLQPGYALLVAGFDGPESHTAFLNEVRAALPPSFDFVTPMPYTGLQQMLDESAPWGINAYEKAHYLDELSAGAIDVIDDQMPRKSSPMSFCPAFPLGGAYRDAAENASAFGGRRSAGLVFNAAAVCPTPELLAADRAWVRGFWEALRPYANAGSYINFMAEYDEDRVRAAFGPKYDRLAAIKATYDPDNVFHRGVNIKPAS